MIRWLLDQIYITPARALEMGYTHAGRVYGIPAWVTPHEYEPYAFYGMTKVGALSVVAIFFDLVHLVWSDLTTPKGEIRQAPIHMLEPIAERCRVDA